MSIADQVCTLDICGYQVTVDDALGSICVAHDGSITWDRLQEIKNSIWGRDARAIEVYPRATDVVNNGSYRHLWRLGEYDFCPDLLGFTPKRLPGPDSLQERCSAAWREAMRVFA